MRIPPQEWAGANVVSAFGGTSADGLTGSLFNIASTQSALYQSVIGSGPSVTTNSGAGGYSGGGQSPGGGSPGGGNTSTGGVSGTAGGNVVGGQDPGNLASPLLPGSVVAPEDDDDDLDEAADYSDWSGLGGTGHTMDYSGMPNRFTNPDIQPQPLPGALLGCPPCAGSSAGSAVASALS